MFPGWVSALSYLWCCDTVGWVCEVYPTCSSLCHLSPTVVFSNKWKKRTVLCQVDCFIQCEVVGWMVFSHVIRGRPGGLFDLSGGEPVIFIY